MTGEQVIKLSRVKPPAISCATPYITTVHPVTETYKRIACPNCGERAVGFYEVCAFRREARLDAEGELYGPRIDSILDQELIARTANGYPYLDCFACGYCFSVELKLECPFHGDYI